MLLSKFKYYPEMPEDYLTQVLKYEGGYTDDKNDAGNQIRDAKGRIIGYSATCRGVTEAALKKAKVDGIVASTVTIKSLLTDLESVRKIYNINYYLAAKCDKLPHPLAFCHLDMSINSGIGGKNKSGKAIGAGANLQKSLISMGANIALDGSVGPKTLAALDDMLTKKSINEIVKIYNDNREKYYKDIVAARPINQKYLKGWLSRLNSVRKFCGV